MFTVENTQGIFTLNQQEINYALFRCGKHVQKAETLAEQENKNEFTVERIVHAYEIAKEEAEKVGWLEKLGEIIGELNRWKSEYKRLIDEREAKAPKPEVDILELFSKPFDNGLGD